MRTRIIALAVLTSVLATCLFAIPLGVAVLEYALQHERGHLIGLAREVATSVSVDVVREDPIAPEQIDDATDGDDDHAVTVLDADGRTLFGDPPEQDAGTLSHALDGDVDADTDGDLLVAAVPVNDGDQVVGAVFVSTPRRDLLADVALIWAGMAGLAAAAVTAAWLVGRRQASWLARPLEDLEERAGRLGDGDFSVRSRRGGIEEIDAVGAALDATAMRLDDLLARERAFSADASHQLRTPLAGMRLRLEAALERADPVTRPAIAASLDDADRLETIIDELLTLARAGQTSYTGPIELDSLLGELSPEWGARLALHGRDLEVHVDPGASAPQASTAAVRQVLRVLVDNATTHGRGTVTVAVREASGAVAVDVSDEGAGVQEPEAVLFARGADRRHGHGMGLALARRLAEAEGGRLHLTRAAPPVFTLLLPAAAPRAEEAHGGGGATRSSAP